MFYLEVFEDRLLMSSILSIAPLSTAPQSNSPNSASDSSPLPVLNAALLPAIASTPDLSLSGFSLVNSSTNTLIGPLVNGETIDLANYPKQGLSIQAETVAPSVGSILFGYDGNTDYHVENYVPYCLIGDGDVRFSTWQPTLGSNTVSATSYSSSRIRGTSGETITVNFNVIDSAAVTGLTLVNADTDQSLGPIVEGQTIDLSDLPTQNLAIATTSNPSVLGSVVFGYDANANYCIENYSNYALAGQAWGGLTGWTPTVGEHTITATPYSQTQGLGDAGTPLSIDFNVVVGATATVQTANVTGFTLIDADNGQSLGPITEGQTIDLASLPTSDLAITAATDQSTGSVVFGYDTNADYQVANTAPYTLISWTPTLGSHTLTATTYTATAGNGAAGTPASVDFTVINSAASPSNGSTVTLSLADDANDDTPETMNEGQVIDLATLQSPNVLFFPSPSSSAINSIVIGLDGNPGYRVLDNPFYFLNWTATLGVHTITATPFSGIGGTGTAGTPLTIDFTVINSASPPTLGTITNLGIVDTDNGQFLESLVEGQTVNLGSLPTPDITIVAVPNAEPIGSVMFGYDGTADAQTTDTAPYEFTSWMHTLGSHTITVTPYSAADGAGTAGSPLTVDFTVANTSASGLTLIDADNGEIIAPITNGTTIDMGTLPTQDLAIVAGVSPSVGSVVFGYDSNADFAEGNSWPFTLASWTPSVGSHTMTATPYSSINALGIAGTPLSVNFTVIDSATAAPSDITGFTLIDTDNGQALESLSEGDTIDLAQLPTQDLSIVADTDSNPIGSVAFGYDGNSNFDVENNAPYQLPSWTPTVGSHTITATAYSAAYATGTAGTPLSMDFTVVNSDAVSGFNLIDSDTGQLLGALTNGEILNLATLPTTDLSIAAIKSPNVSGSIVFGLDNNPDFEVDNRVPYEISPFTATVGSHTLTATPYSAADAAGFAGTGLSVNFTVINSATAVTKFILMNADTGQSLGAITPGETIDLYKEPGTDLTVVAGTIGSPGSVEFGYDNNANFQLDNSAPFALAGSNGSTYIAWTPTVGTHTISATPYTAGNAAGIAGAALSIQFTVINSAPGATPPLGNNNPAISVSITNPVNGESQAGPGYYVIRTATNDTSGTIDNVNFYVNGALLGDATVQPFSMAWENASPGSYVLTAVASDGTGSTASAPVEVTITAPLVAQTIYVNANGGSNSNNGLTLGGALQTITAAANIAQPGDTILIEPGTYRETVTVPTSGTATNPITFQAAVPGTVIIDGADPIGGWTANTGTTSPIFTTAWAYNFFHSGSRYFMGLSTDGTTTTVGYAEQFLYNNKPLTQVLSLASMAAGDFYINYSAATVSVWLPSGATPTSTNMLASTRNHLLVPASSSIDYIRIDGITFQHAANFAQDGAVQTSTGWRLTNCTIQGVNSSGIEVRGNDVLMYNDHALNNGDTGIDGSGTNDLFLDDETAGNNYKGFSVANEAGGGKFSESDGLYFDHYYAHNNVGPGLWFDYENTNFAVVNSYFYDNQPRVAAYEGIGLQIEISQGPARIQNDSFYNNTGPGLAICESMNVTVTNNFFYNNYLELRDLPNRAPYHIQNIQIDDNDFDNSFICTANGTWTTTSAATKQISIDNDIFDDSGPLVYWNSIGYSNLTTITNTLGIEPNGLLGLLSFTAAPAMV